MKGIDISHWNGVVNWQEIKLDQDFVFMKISQRTTTDSRFAQYYADAVSHGFTNLGGYIYNKVKTVEEAKAEARHAVTALNGKTLPFGVMLDMEDASMKKLGKNTLTKIIDAEAEIMEAAGFNVGIYCNLDWYKNVLDSAKLSSCYVFWIARYPANDNGTIKESLSPLGLAGCAIWQYSSKGRVDGISGNVDLNIADDDIKKILDSGWVARPKCPFTMPTYTLYRFRPGMKADHISWMQWHLNRIGYYNGNIDGKFGSLTNAALGLFQREAFGKADFKCGPATRKALLDSMSPFD